MNGRLSHRIALACAAILATCSALRAAPQVTWISSTEGRPWQTMPQPQVGGADENVTPEIRVATTKTAQTIDGFGGCFNELGWQALGKASNADRAKVMQGLFGDDGCAFNLGRIPIGASDFAIDGYSLAMTPDDYDLKDFSIARDEKLLLPYIRAAIAVRPGLRCWASPWSPPAWMKTNNSYSAGSIRNEPRVLQTYANYFVRWLEAYRAAGIDIYSITPQNEPNIVNKYPTCLWTGPQIRDFIAGHLGPALRDHHANVELWLGLNGDPPNAGDNINARLTPVLDSPEASAFLTGVAFQYDSRNQIAVAHQLYPEKKLMQSETECFGGRNSWGDATRLYESMRRYFNGGANAYFMWNMVLDNTGLSSWGWKQNAMISVDPANGKITFNGEYYVMRHFSQYVKPGAKRVLTTGIWGDKIAFVNPDGSTVMVIGNSDGKALPVNLDINDKAGDRRMTVTLPAKSISTLVVPAR